MKTSLFAIFICLFSSILFAQESAYQVLSLEGNILSNGKAIAPKTNLTSSQSIEAGENSYLCLISADKKEIIEVNKKGIFKIEDLPKNLSSNNYKKIVVDELTWTTVGKVETKNRFQHMNKTGSVTCVGMYPIVTMIPQDNPKLYGNQLLVKWFVKEGALFAKDIDAYKILITNLNDNILFEEKVKQIQISINFSKQEALKKENIWILKVVPLGKNDKELESAAMIAGDALTRLEQEKHNQITQELQAVGIKETAFGKLIEARFFEDKELYLDAIVAYEEALKLSFGAKEVQKVYQFFLERNNFPMPEKKE